jgi:hypothetical protein
MNYSNSTIEILREELDFLNAEEVENYEVYSKGLEQIRIRLDIEESILEGVAIGIN